MYEISLVPDIKAELLKKQKIRNLVILVCVVVAIACGAIILILGGVVAGQKVMLSEKDNEIKCRSTGEGRCVGTGTAVKNFHNLEELLTMQQQMKDLDALNSSKIKLSRLFPMFDAILPDDKKEGTVVVTEASLDFEQLVLHIEAKSENSIAFTAQEAYRKNSSKVYFDYGSYMRLDKESGEYVAIPSFCIEEVTENGIVYGNYYKGKAGCEAPMVSNSDEKEDESENVESEDDPEKAEQKVKDNLNTNYEIIKIRRTYTDQSDRDTYKEGNDKLQVEGEAKISGYYFESECIKYDSEGKFDETETLETCALVDGEAEVFDGNYGKNDEDKNILTFSSNLTLNREAFVSANKHMMIVGPTRRNVTDSYEQVRPIFGAKDEVVKEND